MGIMDFVKGGVREMVVARPDAAKRFHVYKHPDNTIPRWSQLTIDADEAAVFFRDGSLVGVLRTAGVGQRHTMDTGNIPFLSNLVDNFTGGNIFVTDLYFVTMRPIRNTKFGGALQAMKDPELEITVSPRIFGDFVWRVAEPDKFIVNYLGLGESPSNERVESFITTKFMNSVKKVVPTFVIREKIEVQALGAYHDELGTQFLQRCDDLSDIGVQFLQLGDFSINFSDDEMKRIQEAQDRYADIKAKKRAKDDLTGGNYMQYAAAEAMLGAGEGMAKGGGEGGGGAMQGGAGLGMGFAMANAFAGQMNPQFQQGGVPQQGMPQQAMPQQAPPQAAGGLVQCPGCSARVPGGKFCAECGTSLAPPQPKACPACQQVNPPGGKFCANCGTSMNG